MFAELANHIQNAFDRCKAFLEAGMQGGCFQVRPDAYLALLELRNMMPEVVLALNTCAVQSGKGGPARD